MSLIIQNIIGFIIIRTLFEKRCFYNFKLLKVKNFKNNLMLVLEVAIFASP